MTLRSNSGLFRAIKQELAFDWVGLMILGRGGNILCRWFGKVDIDYGLALSFVALVAFVALGGQDKLVNEAMWVTAFVADEQATVSN